MKIGVYLDPYNKKIASIVGAQTNTSDKLLIQGGGWGGDILTRSNRKGLSIWETQFLEDPVNLKKIKELGYNKLVMISESPMLHAVQAVNPGQSDRKRHSYESKRTPIVENWPILYRTEDIIIQDIP
jgi:hypothetical protein